MSWPILRGEAVFLCEKRIPKWDVEVVTRPMAMERKEGESMFDFVLRFANEAGRLSRTISGCHDVSFATVNPAGQGVSAKQRMELIQRFWQEQIERGWEAIEECTGRFGPGACYK